MTPVMDQLLPKFHSLAMPNVKRQWRLPMRRR
jgi:hypothetical protein